jgi:hypothetical protein
LVVVVVAGSAAVVVVVGLRKLMLDSVTLVFPEK